MCGIVGFWRFSAPDPTDCGRLERMAATLVHRGPDDFGYLLADAAHGHTSTGKTTAVDFLPDLLVASRRLAIVDLTPAGRQPIANESGDVFVVFNGAIHNFVELRAELKSLGHVFTSDTDTEVIVHAYEEWGEGCATRFNGMWAYVIWDVRRQQLVCSRDRFGIKPLVMAWHGDTFYFASEAKAILAGGEVRAEPNLSFVRRFMNPTVPVSGDETAFAGIEQLPAGHNLVVTRHGRRQAPFWSYAEPTARYDLTHPEETFRELFADAVRLRLRSDVPIALLLSGGLDSSSIAVHAKADERGRHLEAFTSTFPGFAQDERRYAELVAAQSGMRLHCVEYDPARLFDDLAAATWHMDEPASGGQLLARWQLLENASGRARIVLEGQGADEMLGGYATRYRMPYLRSELAQLTLGNFHRKLPLMLSALTGLDQQWPRRTLRALRRRELKPRPRYSVLSPDLVASDDDPEPPGHWHWQDPLTALLHRDHAWLVLPHLLHFGDAISMAHSVESRLPFLDHRLVEFIFALPFDEKIRGGVTKYILRKAFANELPTRIVQRRDKVGFATPVGSWLAPKLDEIRSWLSSSRVRNRGIFDDQGLARCLAEAEAGKPAATNLLFRCLALETWFELFVDGDGPPARAARPAGRA